MTDKMVVKIGYGLPNGDSVSTSITVDPIEYRKAIDAIANSFNIDNITHLPNETEKTQTIEIVGGTKIMTYTTTDNVKVLRLCRGSVLDVKLGFASDDAIRQTIRHLEQLFQSTGINDC